VVLGSGGPGSGSVTFSLYLNGNCTGAPAAQFVGIPLVGGTARTNNTTSFHLEHDGLVAGHFLVQRSQRRRLDKPL